jgi:RNA polymerase sigma factor (sigma-70 family)
MDNKLFEKTVKPFQNDLLNYALHLTHMNREDANDLVQETLLRAFRFFDSYDDQNNTKGWLFTIMHNTFVSDCLKKKRRVETILFDESLHSPETEEPTDKLLGDEIIAALARLPERYRQPFVMFVQDGYSYEEIARLLSIPIGTVRSRIHRAKGQLRRQLSRSPSPVE